MSHGTAGVRQAAPAIVVGVVCIVAGGLVAAVTAPSPTEHGTWAAAYLVLVAGVSQVGLAVGQSLLTARTPAARTRVAELVTWNVGNAAVLTGTLTGTVWIVDLGGALLVAALALVVVAVHRHPVQGRWPQSGSGTTGLPALGPPAPGEHPDRPVAGAAPRILSPGRAHSR